MTDQAVETPTPETQTSTDAVTSEKEEIDWKAESRKWETRAKDNATAAAQLAAIEEANKTEAQKLSERAEKAEQALAAKDLEATRALVALDKGLTANQAKRLVGSTREEFLADADLLIADLGKQPTGPRADHSQGVKAAAGPQAPRDEFADLIRAKSAR